MSIKEGHNMNSTLSIGGKEVPIHYNGSHYVVDLANIGIVLGNHATHVHLSIIPNNVTVELNSIDKE